MKKCRNKDGVCKCKKFWAIQHDDQCKPNDCDDFEV